MSDVLVERERCAKIAEEHASELLRSVHSILAELEVQHAPAVAARQEIERGFAKGKDLRLGEIVYEAADPMLTAIRLAAASLAMIKVEIAESIRQDPNKPAADIQQAA